MGFLPRKKKAFIPAKNLSAKKTVSLTPIESGKPAANVSLIKQNGVNFEKKVNSAVSLQKDMGVANRFDVIGLIDESYSMDDLFDNGTVQEITERILAWTAGVDADGMAPVGGFASGFEWHGEIDLSNVMGCASTWNTWGGTDLTAGLREAFEVAKGADNPVYLFIVTDGAPNDRQAVIDLIAQMSEYPIFIKIVLVGDDPQGKKFVEYLDDLEKHEPGRRLFDNTDAQHIRDASRVSDDDFNKAMTEEVPSAIDAMRQVGLVV
ncbi:hypothetical protein SEA_WOFFORD_169 [Streptomyces phage Wofford]|uniref:VWFA domain-containing protein n=1 Tax=Streptomyces phage Wofford TaxID=2283267 RepID=A0A345MA01_9CAUD|nr:VWA domain-containing protein [Streptomyces phage Wollford]AXH67322.1 hypothetical protein SEA_WOFFORD_169 [Streptomyces phage Wollford]